MTKRIDVDYGDNQLSFLILGEGVLQTLPMFIPKAISHCVVVADEPVMEQFGRSHCESGRREWEKRA